MGLRGTIGGVRKKRMALTTLGMTAASLVLGFVSGRPILMLLAMTPSIAFFALLAIIPYRQYLKELNSIRDDSYFKDKDEDVIIESANRYIDVYNEHILS